MKISKKFILTICVISFCSICIFSSCEKDSKTIYPETKKIGGNLGEYFELIDEDYPIPEYSSAFRFNVKRIKESDPGLITKFSIGYKIYDKKGKVIDSERTKPQDLNPTSDFSFLSLKVGETGSVKIYLKGWPEKLKGAKSFKISFECDEENDQSSRELFVYEDETKIENKGDISNLISLNDFIEIPDIKFDIRKLKRKGFSHTKNPETGFDVLKKDGITIEYSEDFSDDGEGSRCITIAFPEIEDAYNFASVLKSDKNWKADKAPLGEWYTFRNGKLTVYREISNVQISSQYD